MSKERKKRRTATSLQPTLVKIVRSKDGGPIRTVVERGHGKATGIFTSRKNRRAFPWEAIDERHFMWISEVDFRVTSFLVQPFRMEFYFANGEKMIYFPDIERRLGSKVEIIEVKKTRAEIARDPRYAAKIALARAVSRRQGWEFRVISADTDLLPTQAFANAKLIRLDRFTAIGSEDHVRLPVALLSIQTRASRISRLAFAKRADCDAAFTARRRNWDRSRTWPLTLSFHIR
ncbi:Tn7 transposase TnsA N-terminal domain-containing protein [Bradyrhizobium sp. SYSU BS000235]|uniref:Tn7 transposase TnsA N-terminal domain-containing protein n=1 Tax=Bradyrhizobium sp. SYSU BS000235 TaxID=3411332 RepID=UPI003C742585